MTENTEKTLPWERQKGERDRQFQLFTIYRDLGATRSLEKVVTECSENEEYDKISMSYVCQLSAKFGWVNRSSEWDDYLDEVARTEHELAVKEMIKRHATNSKDLQETVLSIKNDPKFEELTPTQKAWVLNSATHSYSKLALLERLSRGESTERAERSYSGLSEFARTIESSIEKAKKSE
jgi:hypothetical protein